MTSRRILWALNFLAFIIYAILATAIGPSLPELSREFSLTPDLAGALASVYSLGGMAAILGGWVSDRIGRGLMVSISLVAIGLGALLMGVSPVVPIVGAALLLIGVGAGFFEASSNAMVSDLYAEKRGMAVNLLHIAWNVGSGFGPPIIALIIGLTMSWRLAYLLFLPFIIPVAILILLFSRKLPRLRRNSGEGFNVGAFLRAFPLASISIFIVAVEMGLSAWLPSLLMGVGATLFQGGLTIGLFWGLMGVGRLVWAPFTDKLGYGKSMLISGGLGTASMTAATLPLPLYLRMGLWAASGFFLAPLFPTLIAWITTLNPRAGGAFSGMVFTLGTLGSFASTWLTGITVAGLGVQRAQYIFPALSLAIILNTLLAKLVTKKSVK